MRKKSWIILSICLLLVILLLSTIFYNIENTAFKERNPSLEDQVGNLNSQLANISTALNTVDKIFRAPGTFTGIPCLKINGIVKNLGGAVACQVGLQVVAYDSNSKTIAMAITIPLNNGA